MSRLDGTELLESLHQDLLFTAKALETLQIRYEKEVSVGNLSTSLLDSIVKLQSLKMGLVRELV